MLRSEGNSKGKPVRTDANDRTGAALSEAAAKLGSVQPEIVTQGLEQRHVGRGVHRLILAVHAERYFCHANTPLEARERTNSQRSILIIS